MPVASNLTEKVTLDNSIGRDTRLVFTYYNNLDVYVTHSGNNDITIIRDSTYRLITVRISGIVVSHKMPHIIISLYCHQRLS